MDKSFPNPWTGKAYLAAFNGMGDANLLDRVFSPMDTVCNRNASDLTAKPNSIISVI